MILLPAAAVPAGAATYTAGSSDEFHRALAKAQNGDTIQLNGSFVLKNPQSNNDSLVIDKAVTIQGGGLTLWYAGILLGADVTFKDMTLGLGSNVRPAIMANGHTLTLENVQRDPTARHINLFCGGQTGGTQGDLAAAKQGSHGEIVIKGNTYLGPTGRIFAGSLSTDDSKNVFAKPATVTIDPSVSGDVIGELYACGALETYTSENDWFDYEHEINPPFASPGNFQVSGKVTFNLYQGKVGKVSGDTGSSGNLAQVNYSGTDYLNDNLVLSNIGGLTVNSGNLAPVAGRLEQKNASTTDRTSEIVPVPGSSFFGSGAPLGVAAGATLGLQKLDSPVTAGDFTGGGALVLGQSQKLVVTGTVSGTTTVGIGGIFNGHSQAIPTVGNTYIDAVSSVENSFTLAAPASRPDIKLVRDATTGAWKAVADEKVVIVNDFKLASAVVEASSGPDVELPTLAFQDVLPANTNYPFSSIELTISVNTAEATVTDDGSSYTYSTSTLSLSVAVNNDQTGEVLQISNAESEFVPVPAGAYVISVTVPAANSGTGQPITRTATLTVKAAGGVATTIPEPKANEGLVYNGQEQVGVPVGGAYVLESGTASATGVGNYTATVKPATGFTWADGSSIAKDIVWSIAKAANPNPLPRLSAAAPTTYGARDGKISGTTGEMEYSTDENFTSPAGTACMAAETTGLPAGGYYVRYKGDVNHLPGTAVPVTVPQGPLTVRSIAISSTDHKKAYQVGEPLDVTGLTLAVTMSDNSQYLVPVAAGMVSGFDSSSIAASRTLTVTYGGKTTAYTISVSENTGADPTKVAAVTLNKPATTLTVGASERLTATISPDTAVNKNVIWASRNTSVATVDAAGTVTAVSAGTAVITVTTEDGGKTASCTVTVNPGGGSAGGGGSTGGGGSSGGGVTGGGSGSSGGGGGSSSAGDSSSSNTTTNADGSVTTTVTDKETGTVTTTTKKTDGSTTVVETKKDGAVTITDTAKNGVKVEAVSKPGTDTSARVTLPASVETATVTLPVEVTPGTVAVDARTGEVVKLSAPTEAGMAVKLDGSAELILEDRSKAFTDTDGHWAKNAIDFTTAHALFNGTSDTTFAPNQPMTRGMVAVVLHNFEGNPDSAARTNFIDVASDKWYTDAINWVTDKGIAGGYGNGSFGAKDPVTREQLVTILYRYADAMGYGTEGGTDLSAFSDGASVSAYAYEAMGWAVGNGLIVGTDRGVLAPRDSATRAQVASILNRFVLNLMK